MAGLLGARRRHHHRLAGLVDRPHDALDLWRKVRLGRRSEKTEPDRPVGRPDGKQIDAVDFHDGIELLEAFVALEHRHQVRGPVGLAQRVRRIGAKREADAGRVGGCAALADRRVLSQPDQLSRLLDTADVGQRHHLKAAVEQALNVGSAKLKNARQGHHPEMGDDAAEPEGLGRRHGAVLEVQPNDVIARLREQLDIGQRRIAAQDGVKHVVGFQQLAKSVFHGIGSSAGRRTSRIRRRQERSSAGAFSFTGRPLALYRLAHRLGKSCPRRSAIDTSCVRTSDPSHRCGAKRKNDRPATGITVRFAPESVSGFHRNE